MHEAIHQYLPELMSFLKDIVVGYIIYRITNGASSTPCSKPPVPRGFHLFRNPVKPS